MATIEDFERIDMRVGRVISVDDFPEARKPAWKLEVDFGAEILLRPDDEVPPGGRVF